MFNLYYRNLQLLILTLVLIIVWGLTAFFSLPRLEDPELTPRFGIVTTLFPSATPDRVESLVTEKLEEELFEIEAIDHLTSTSRLGISIVEIELKDSVNNVDDVWSEIRDTISDTEPLLPQGALEPEFEIGSVGANALIVGLVWADQTPPNQAILRRLAENLQDELRGIPGTEEVEIFGDPEEEILVEIDPVDLTALGLTPQQLAQQIQASDAKVSAGQLRSETSNLLFEVLGELDTLERIRQIPIQFGATGQFTRLGNIAEIRKGIQDPPEEISLVQGRRAVVVAATVESQDRVDEWAEVARQRLAEIEQGLPAAVQLHRVLDQSRYVEARLNGVMGNLLIGASLVVSVTLIFMGWRSALVVGSALPLSTLMVFGSMKILGIPLHQISITGLIIALGLLIDNAIIVVDEVQGRLRSGIVAAEAVGQSTHHLVIPLLSSSLTTILAFMPIALAPGSVGEFTGTIGVTVILALTSSLILSLTVIPGIVGHLNHWLGIQRGSQWWQVGFANPRMSSIYRQKLAQLFKRPLIGVLLGLVLPLAGFMTFPHLPQQFFPPAGRDQIYIEVQLATQAAITETQSIVLAAHERIVDYPSVDQVHWFIGEGAPRFYYNVIGGQRNSPNYAQALVQLSSARGSKQLIQDLQVELDQTFPEAQILVRQLEQGPPFDAPIEVRIYGPDLNQLRDLGNQLRAELAAIPQVIHTRADLTEALPKLGLRLDEDEARLAGLDKTAIAQQLQAYLEGSIGGSVLEETEELPVRVRLSNQERADLNQIESLDLMPTSTSLGIPVSNSAASTGQASAPVPLSALGSVKLIPDLAIISRRDGQRNNTVQAFLNAGILPATILAQFQQRLADTGFELPPGYRLDFGGEAEARGSSIANLLSTVGVLAILMTATLVLSFNSFALAGLIGVIAFCAIGLGTGALYLSGYPFGFTAILGTLGLIGLAINDSIVVLAAIRAHPIARYGSPTAILEVVIHSTRHVIATTLTTLVGFVPLLFDATGFWPPLAICIAGGLGGATIMALILVPCVYLLLHHRIQPNLRPTQSPTPRSLIESHSG